MTHHELSEPADLEPIAIIGMACRVPGAANVEQFWDNLKNGVESIRTFSEEEVVAAGASPRSVADPQFVRAAPVLDDIENFDAGLFGFTRREAEILDPQHRVFLECAVAALENAGYDPGRYDGDIGVYGGVGAGEYQWYHLLANRELVGAVGHMAIALANNSDYVTTLTSYKLNLRGPSLSVATACSTGLVSIHLACEAVRNGECDMALAGAASVELTQLHGYLYQDGSILSPDGHCRTFDAEAKGTLWGSGGAVVVLKRLSDAVADGDNIRAVILGSSINNDGSDKVGFSAPSISGQSEVIDQALGIAGVEPETISYVEAHGTATLIGDPIEVRALTDVFQRTTDKRQFCGLGSVKPNIGHLAAAAGVVGLIKTVLSLENEALPPTLHFQTPNPAIDFEASPFHVVDRLTSWQRSEQPRRAGVSSFGMGGTNAHAVVEEAPRKPASRASGDPQVVVLSAQSQSALETVSANLLEYLSTSPGTVLDDVAYTLQVGRRPLLFRRALVCDSVEDATQVLSGTAPRRLLSGKPSTGRRQVFVFPGQGTQHVGMTRELYERYDVVREHIDHGAALLHSQIGYDLRDVLFATGEDVPAASERLQRTGTTQPALFLVEYALAQLWMSWQVTPEAMIGHSLGEYVAACLAGVFSFEDGLRLVAARAALMEAQPRGGMLAVALDEESLELDGTGLSLAAVNAPTSCVVSGPFDDVAAYEEELAELGVPVKRLRTSHAFHSPMMEPAREAFARVMADVRLQAPRIPVISNVTGTWLTEEQATSPAYWADHMCASVLFSAGLQTLFSSAPSVLLEVGPGNVLGGLARMQLAGDTPDPVASLAADATSEVASMLGAAARLWTLGVDVEWATLHDTPRRRVALPGRPFERQRYWIDDAKPTTAPVAEPVVDEQRPLPEWFWVPGWRQVARLAPAPLDMTIDHGVWLVLADDRGRADGVVERLRHKGARVVTVRPGAQFSRLSAEAFAVDPASAADFEQVIGTLAAEGRTPTSIVHCWTLGESEGDLLDTAAVEAVVPLAYSSLIALAQALAARGSMEEIALTVLSSNANDVTGDDLDNPAKALATGPLRVITQEFADVMCRNIDVDLAGAHGDVDVAGIVLDEIAAGATEPFVAYRRGRRWLPALEPAMVEESATAHAGLRAGGVYVITGGLGGVGLSLAEDLARRCGARLVLVSRSAMPARVEWERLARSGSRVGRQARALLRLEELGAEVLVVNADVSRPDDVKAVRDAVISRFGEVHGVIHAAGVAGGTMIEAQSPTIASRVFDAKVLGAVALSRVFDQDPLDFLVLCSSVTAIAGGIGQVDYCAANAFLDAFARVRSAAGRPVVSINWGAWLEVGMAAEAATGNALRDVDVRRETIHHPLLDIVETSTGSAAVTCTVTLDARSHWVLDEHRISGTPVLPGTGYLEMVRAAFARGRDKPVELTEVVFLTPLAVPEGTTRDVRVLLDDGVTGGSFVVESWTGSEWQLHARGTVGWASMEPTSVRDIDAITARCPRVEEGEALEASASGMVTFGDHWGSLRRVYVGTGEEIAFLDGTGAPDAETSPFWADPALLDEATSFGDFAGATAGTYLPLGYGRIALWRPLPARLVSHLRHRDVGSSELITCDLTLCDENGGVVAEINDFMLRRVEQSDVSGSMAQEPDAPAQPASRPTDEIGIAPGDGGEAFVRVLGARLGPQVAVTARDLRVLVERVNAADSAALSAALGGETPDATAVQVLDGNYVAPSTDLERELVELWEAATGVAGIGVEHDFFELGGNSLVAAQLIGRIRMTMGVKLPMRMVFDSPTVAGMARLIEKTERAAS